MKKVLGLLLMCVAVSLNAQHKGQHHIWNGLLKKYVTETGTVDYKTWSENTTDLERYCFSLGANPPQVTWSANEQKAYWLNVYNAFTIKIVLEHYPIKSIKDIPNVWNEPLVVLGEDTLTLNQVEKDMLLAKFNDPRIHMGVNCASVSCPKLSNKAFFANNLDEHLDALTRGFLADGSRNQLFRGEVRLNMIFNWYETDFTKEGSLVDFLNKYAPLKIKDDAFVSYIDYNWNLNE